MNEQYEGRRDFEGIIKSQRERGLTQEELKETIERLPNEHIVDYFEFLEHNCPEKITNDIGEMFLRKLGARNEKFIEKWSGSLTSGNLKKLEALVLARADNLLDVYLHTVMPDDIINEFVLLKAERIDKKFQGKYRNALAMITLAIEIQSVQDPDDLFDTFMRQEQHYYETGSPNVDVNTFYKLVIPMLRRYSIKLGVNEFHEIRDKVIDELRKHGVNPGHLSIDVLERRGKHRRQPTGASLYRGYELF